MKKIKISGIVKHGSLLLELVGETQLISKLYLEHFSDGNHKLVSLGSTGWGNSEIIINDIKYHINYNIFNGEFSDKNTDYYMITNIPENLDIETIKNNFKI